MAYLVGIAHHASCYLAKKRIIIDPTNHSRSCVPNVSNSIPYMYSHGPVGADVWIR